MHMFRVQFQSLEPTTSPAKQQIPISPAKETQQSNEYSSSLDTFMETLKKKTRGITMARVLILQCHKGIGDEEERRNKGERENEKKKENILEATCK